MHRAFSPAVRILALALICGHLFSALLAGLPSLHDCLHGHSDEADHQCAVTAVLDGRFDRSTAHPVVVIPPALRFEAALIISSFSRPLVAPHSALRGRAPPLA
jgi:hypothetical protein